MTTNRIRARGALTFLLTAATLFGVTLTAAAPAPLAAQSDADARACRCVDRDGDPIENCTCFRSVDPDRLIRGGLWTGRTPGRLGVTVRNDQSPRHDGEGAHLTDVLEDGPADRAGLRAGDVITRIDGHSLFDPLDPEVEEDFDLDRSIPVQRLLAIVRELEPGREVDVEYRRDGELRAATLTTEELGPWGALSSLRFDGQGMADRMRALEGRLREGTNGLRSWQFAMPEDGNVRVWSGPGGDVRVFDRARLDGGRFARCPERDTGNTFRMLVVGDACPGGMELVELNPNLAEYFGTDGGVLVADVHEESPLGLQAGDVIIRVGERTVESADHLRRILRSYEPDEDVVFHIVRRNAEMSVQGRLGIPE